LKDIRQEQGSGLETVNAAWTTFLVSFSVSSSALYHASNYAPFDKYFIVLAFKWDCGSCAQAAERGAR
jgi:hypothetical protein